MTNFRQSAALLWRRILATDPDIIFGSEASRLLNRNWADRLPQPGYTGMRYRPGGLVFVSMNPGAGPQEGFSADDRLQYRALEGVRDANDETVSALFDELTLALAEIMPRWKIYRNFVAPFLQAAEVDFSQVAYVNLLKWRTRSSSGLARLYNLSWNHHTCDQIELLSPSHVIAIGSDAGRAFKKHYCGDADFDFVPGIIGNNVGPEGREALARIADKLKARRPGLRIPHSSIENQREQMTSNVQSNRVVRAQEIARQLGMNVRVWGPSGEYPKESTGTSQVDAIAFTRQGRDCVGFEGRGQKMGFLNEREASWNAEGFRRHQVSANSHKSAVTFIQEYAPQPDGSIDPRLMEAYEKVKKLFGRASY